MGERWSQRNAWIVWCLASLVGWLAIGVIALMPLFPDEPTLAENPADIQRLDIKPTSGPIN